MTRDIAWMGDSAALIRTTGFVEARRLAEAVRAREWCGVNDVVPAADSLGLIVDPADADAPELALAAAALDIEPLGQTVGRSATPRTHLVEAVFDGEDLGSLAGSLGITESEIVALVAGAELEVGWLGYQPGFAYLVGLPEPLEGLGRRAEPRTSVPPGSIALGGGYAGIYPRASPGGWHLVGRTAFSCFDPRRRPFATFAPGDRVRFSPVVEIFSQERQEPQPPNRGSHGVLKVLDPGMQLMVQTRGRQGVGSIGVPRGGAMDEAGLRIANRAVGNREDAAALELLGGRCRIRFGRDAFAALTSEMPLVVEGTEMEAGVVAEVRAGETVEIGPLGTRARAVLAVSGGIRTPFVLASRSSDAMSGLPGGALLAGAELAVGARGRARGRFELLRNESPCLLAVMLGPDELDAARLAPLLGELYLVEQASNRTGLRLDSPSSSRAGAGAAVSTVPSQATVPSHAMVPGAVQLTPSGLPIILGPDCGPVGGYPVAMTVISSDLWRLALLRPGDVISFEAVDRDEATRRLSMLEHRISEAVTGWYPTGFA